MLFVFEFVILAGIVLAQPSPPAQGIQIGHPLEGFDIRFPLTVTQCESVFIYYNTTTSRGSHIVLSTRDYTVPLLSIGPTPLGVGYFEWVCNVPAGYDMWASFLDLYIITVQPGPSSSCLHDVTTTYQYASYVTTAFASYTAHPITTS